ncbi:pyridoxal-dependent decarboxylase [Histomonas meleagridis]|uniref:pyridoxal-dependent decarboxylase n=1 Tax=Histomonas meleagridis TaxID=135588 RepID=UPI0035594F2E|nr:pyridoxal-dependent decarboxylase [Histomonas meleagridis]
MSDYQLLKSAYSVDGFKEMANQVLDILIKLFPTEQTAHEGKTLPYITPEEQLKFWNEDFNSPHTTFPALVEKFISHSLNLSNKRNLAHQLSVTLPITMLTAAVNARLNNVPTHYQLGMAAVTMERVIVEHMVKKFGFREGSTGTIVTGGSMGNLTSLVTARTCYESFLSGRSQVSRLAIMVSEAAHYSVERSAMVMGLQSENIIHIPLKKDCTVDTDLLETKLQEARDQNKIVFCVVGCASTTSHGAHDDLEKIGQFAKKHNIWFHVDGAHGGAAIFSKKYKHLLKGIELADSVIVDFHKMLMVPTTSTIILYNNRTSADEEEPNGENQEEPNGENQEQTSPPSADVNIQKKNYLESKFHENIQTPYIGFTNKINYKQVENGPIDFNAPYLFPDATTNEWYEGGRNTLECSKPTIIFHTYAILRVYGDELLEQNVDALYDLGIKLGELIKSRENIKLALDPQNNIVCFHYYSKPLIDSGKIDEVNEAILDHFLEEGSFYLSSAPIFGTFYLRVTLMNPFTEVSILNEMLDKVEQYGKIEEEKVLNSQ